jgi:hypothetical protein
MSFRTNFLVLIAVIVLVSIPFTGIAAGPNVRGKIAEYEKLSVDVYAEAAKPELKRWSWRDPSPAVAAGFRNLSPKPSREIVLVATNNGANPAAAQPILVKVTGGRTNPATLVITPETQLQFRNDDPFPHKLYIVGKPADWNGAMGVKAIREWKAPQGKQRIEIRDELFPSVRTFIIVEPGAVQSVYPAKDHSFAFTLPSGDYVVKAFFGGKQVGKPTNVTAKEKGVFDIKEAINVSEGGEGK